ncbi:MAG: FAD binding domain-containing protein [Candidatus Limnocylindrales bacterium]
MGSYLRPATLSSALEAMAQAHSDGRPCVIVAGATDYFPARVIGVSDDDVLDLTGLPDLRAIRELDGGWWIPALATWSDVAEGSLPPLFDGLRLAARAVGGRQIQNRGTVVGNVVNASPAADGVPNLLVMDAEVALVSVRGERRLPVAEFVTGNRTTLREPDELVTGLFIPAPGPGSAVRSTFLKLGSRAYLVISIAMVAAVLVLDEGRRVTSARIAVGACSPVAQRLPELEAALLGAEDQAGIGDFVRADHLAPLTPIDDVRGSATYRRHAALTLVRRALEGLAG